jgi:predicted amidohydrolase YtcJ
MTTNVTAQPAGLVLWNGRIWTVDPDLPQGEAVAICGNEIRACAIDDEGEG